MKFVVNARDAFDQGHVASRILPLTLAVEVRGFDHEGIALPPATRVPRPLVDVLSKRSSSIERHNANGVDHLGEQGNMVWSL